MDKAKSGDMYRLYEEYKDSMKNCKKARNKRQKINREIRAKYDQPFRRPDHLANTNDITHWNSIIRDLEEDMKMIEMYLDFEDRYYLHKEYFDVKSMIYNQNSYEGIVPIEEAFGETIPDIVETICNRELQEKVVELLDDVLTERQRQVVKLYFWEDMTQEAIGKILGIKQNTVSQIIANSLDILRKSIDVDEIIEILRV